MFEKSKIESTITEYNPVHQQLETYKRNSGTTQKWLVFLAWILCVLCTLANALVVITSDGQPVESWKIRPSVILPILSSITGILLAFLLSTGIAVNWWNSALHGTTLEHLHHIADRSIFLQPNKWSARLFKDAGFRRVFFATCIITSTKFLSQPLLQQSTKTRPADFETSELQMNIDLLRQLPDGIGGTVTENPETFGSYDITANALQWYRREPIKTRTDPGYTCDGKCSGIIEAPGISVSCSSSERILDMTKTRGEEDYLFRVNYTLVEDNQGHPMLDFVAQYSRSVDSACQATIVTDRCSVYQALARHPVTIEGDIITLDQQTIADWRSDQLVFSAGDNTSSPANSPAGPLYGLIYPRGLYFGAYSYMRTFVTMGTYGVSAETFYVYRNTSSDSIIPRRCNHVWRSPTEWTLNAFREILFRLAHNGNTIAQTPVVSSGIPTAQTFSANRVRSELAFESNYAWLAGALVADVLGILLAAVVTWGFWRMPREVSMSPAETVQALPPSSGDKDLSADEIIESSGAERIHYHGVQTRNSH